MAKRQSHLNRSTFGYVFSIIVMAFLGIFMLIPAGYTISQAFKPLDELYRYPPTIFAQNPSFKNFTELFNLLNETTMPFIRYFFNTVFLTASAAAGQIIIASLCAYSLAKIPFPGSEFIFKMIVFSLMFSGTVTAIPSFIVYRTLHMVDTYWAVIMPHLVSTMGFYLMKQFMQSNVPNDLLNAARIDGASEINVFFKIAMPLLKPAWYTLVILSIQGLWGSSAQNVYHETLKNLPQAISQISTGGLERAGVSAAASLIMIIIPILCFVVMQSKIVDTMGSAGLKG